VTTYTDRRISRTSKFLFYGAVIVTLAVLSGGPSPHAQSGAFSPRLTKPRVAPIPEQQREMITPQIREDGSALNLYATMLQHPRLYAPRASFGTYLRSETSLPPRTRELLIMRTAYLIGAEYEWSHHVVSARGRLDGGGDLQNRRRAGRRRLERGESGRVEGLRRIAHYVDK